MAPNTKIDRNKGYIVLVDDDTAMRELLKDFLVGEGYEVQSFASPRQALARFDHPDANRVGLLISDIHMPQINGMQLLGLITARVPHLPVILATAYGDKSGAEKAAEGGAFAYLSKPFRLVELLQTVERAFARAKTPA